MTSQIAAFDDVEFSRHAVASDKADAYFRPRF